jgi:23S rRNA pseudouridine1911/1915/1917 synthase
MDIKIIYENENFLIIDKPAKLITHPKNKNDNQESVTKWLINKYPEIKNVGEPFIASGDAVPRAGVIHRLDKDTSGLLIVAKNDKTFLYFKKLFQNRIINKYYLALVHGKPKKAKGLILTPLGRIGLKRTTQITGKKLVDKKEAETEYKTIKNYGEYTLLEIMPKTGRTHQIRVHLKSIGLPIVGDPIYGFKKKPSPFNLNRMFLHAYKLEFIAPESFTNNESKIKKIIVEVGLPNELQKIIDMLK